jgi:hypothetical protein
MAHGAAPSKPKIDGITATRLTKIPSVEENGMSVIKDFAVFIDTHRDQPHVGAFYDDIHRGMTRPTKVDYAVEDDYLINQETGELLARHEKHLFITNEYFGQFLVDYLMSNGTDPRDGAGCLPTSHFRDARAKVYELKSFREIVRLRHEQVMANKGRKKTP